MEIQLEIKQDVSERKTMLHSLNALRVIFEFIIVSHHITDFDFPNTFAHSFGASQSLMSFFFVLSGFVSMYTTDGLDKTYFMRRMKKTYPFFFLMWLLGIPITLHGNIYTNKCKLHSWIYLILQPLCLENFLGWDVDGSNVPAWYYTVLVCLWFIHSHFDVRHYICNHPLKFMVLFYATSVLLCIPLFLFDTDNVKQLPFVRILEFFMGCAAALSFKNGYVMRGEVALLSFVGYVAFAAFTAAEPQVWVHNTRNGTCAFWTHDEFSFKPSGLITITSLIWAIVIHWLACSESSEQNNVVVKVLCLDIFKSMSKFSLQLYLSHWITSSGLYHSLRVIGILDWFSKDFHMLFVYCSSYMLYVHVQPKLDSWFNKKN